MDRVCNLQADKSKIRNVVKLFRLKSTRNTASIVKDLLRLLSCPSVLGENSTRAKMLAVF